MKIQVVTFCVVTPCSVVNNGSGKVLRNIGVLLHRCTASQPRRPRPVYTSTVGHFCVCPNASCGTRVQGQPHFQN